MEIKKGIPVSPGVAICAAAVLDAEDIHVPRHTVNRRQAKQQHRRLDEAMAAASNEIETLRDDVAMELGHETAAIFGFHLGMLNDKHLINQVHEAIDADLVTAEFAVATVLRRYAHVFMQKDSPLFRERVSDLWDVERRILRQLIDDMRADLARLDHHAVIVAHDLTPSQTAALDKKYIRGLVTDAGGRTSHTAIVARAMGIPSVVGLEDITSSVSTGQSVIVDGNRGLVIINPEPQQIDDYHKYVEELRVIERRLGDVSPLDSETQDGVAVELQANIEFSDEIPSALAKGATGVGLFRTEYLFLSTETAPSEDQQYEAFVSAVTHLGGKPLTIRTLDLGADKYSQQLAPMQEPNPFLGCRSIRYCLQNLPMFKTHLRAILRASAHGQIRIMFPLVTNMLELRQARMILNDVIEDLEDQGIAYDPEIKVGIMIEVPSAALMAKVFIREVDFFSIGTNDLVQYTLAVDRSNEHVANLYSPAHPAVLMLIKDVIRAGKKGKIEVSCCGEMAAEPDFVMLLLGMGLRVLSMTPAALPAVKQVVRAVTIKDCERVARRVASYDAERQILNYLREETRKVIPDVHNGRSSVGVGE